MANAVFSLPQNAISISGILVYEGSGAPETAVTAPVGSLYLRSDGGSGTSVYVKESGTGNTGWKPLVSTSSVPPSVPRVTSVTSSSTPTPNADTTDRYLLTALAVGATFGAPTGSPVEGQSLIIRIKDNGTPQTLAWNAIYRAVNVTLPTTTVASSLLYVGAVYNAVDTKWDVVTVAEQ